MCQHHPCVHITNGIDMRDIRLHIPIHLYTFGREVHARVLQSETFHIGTTSCSDEDDIRFHLFLFPFPFEEHRVTIDAFHATLHEEGNAPFGYGLTEPFGNITVNHRQTLLEELDDCHFTSQAIEHRSHLHANHPGTHDA